MEKNMVRELIFLPMETSMLGIGRMAIFMVKGLTLLLMVTSMRLNGRMEYQMV